MTSNSLQFGANVDAYAAAGGFAVHGYIEFDALFYFLSVLVRDRFSARFDISFDGATLAGINLDASLSGPNPWHLHGDATLTFLFFSVSAVDRLHPWGDLGRPPRRARVGIPTDRGPRRPPQLEWSLPAGTPGVTLRSIAADPSTIVVQPACTLDVREIIVPLDVPITKFNNATPSDGNQFGSGRWRSTAPPSRLPQSKRTSLSLNSPI